MLRSCGYSSHVTSRVVHEASREAIIGLWLADSLAIGTVEGPAIASFLSRRGRFTFPLSEEGDRDRFLYLQTSKTMSVSPQFQSSDSYSVCTAWSFSTVLVVFAESCRVGPVAGRVLHLSWAMCPSRAVFLTNSAPHLGHVDLLDVPDFSR